MDEIVLHAAGLDAAPPLPLVGTLAHRLLPPGKFFVWVHSFERAGRKQPPDLIIKRHETWVDGEQVSDQEEIFDSRRPGHSTEALCKWLLSELKQTS